MKSFRITLQYENLTPYYIIYRKLSFEHFFDGFITHFR